MHQEDNIKRALQIEIEVEKVQPAVGAVQAWVESAGGFVQSQRYLTDTQARIICRVPSTRREAFTAQIKTLGTLKNESTQAEDLSDERVNVDAELKIFYALRIRLKALLEKAGKIEDVLSIERELNRVQARIDYLEKTERMQQKSIQTMVYSLTLIEKEPDVQLGPLGWVVYGAYWTVKKLFIIR